MLKDIAPDVRELFDEKRQSYFVDEDVSYLLTNRRVWTDPDTHLLMIEVKATWAKNLVFVKPLHIWIYCILKRLGESPHELQVLFRDGCKRNLCEENLQRVWRGAI